MNTLLKKSLSIAFFVSSICIPSKPLSETTAQVGAGVGGVVAGVAAGAGTYFLAFDDMNNQTLRAGTSMLVGLGIGGLTGYLLYQWLCTMTPPGRFAAAQVLINNAAFDSLICNDFITDEALFAHATARFGTSWPLVLARERFMSITQNLEMARSLLNLVYQEAQGNPSYAYFCSQCSPLNQKITDIAKIIEPRINAITKSEKYDLQTHLYEKHMEAERKRAHEQSLQSNKLHHDSNERNKDRWHDKVKDDRKYQHQNNIVNQNQNRPVMLNIG